MSKIRGQGPDVGEVFLPEIAQCLLGSAEEGHSAAGGEYENAAAEVDVVHIVGGDDDGAVVVGQFPQGAHDRAVQSRVEPRGRFVKQQQRGLREQLECDARTLALATRKAGDPLVDLPGQVQLGKYLRHPVAPSGGIDVGREPQACGIGQRLAHSELGVQHVVLWNECDAMAQFVVVAIQLAAGVADGAPVSGTVPRQRIEQRGLSRPTRADDRE